jgi:CubicO group peptidase (beta-lactamase class C family)
MAELVTRLLALRPVVERIRRVSGAQGVSVGIIHDAKVVLTENFGFRDVKNKIAPDQDTVYYLASLTKSFTAVGIAHLINETSDLTWDTPVSESYPRLSHKDPEIRRRATIVDFLSHRTGLAPKNHIWSQEYGHFTLKRGEDIRTVTNLEKIADFRSRWIYNNWGYAVADELIEHLGGASWGEFLKDRIFDPLGMARTFTTKQKDDDNIAKAYIALSNGDPWEVEEPDGEDGEILEGALAVKSCVRDLSRYYIAFMQAVKADTTENQSCSSNLPFVDAAKMVEPYIKLSTKSDDVDGSYGLGWIRVRLPCTLGANGMNHGFIGKMPIVGKGIPEKTTCYYHQGSANSFLSSVHLLPETQSGVVVLTNSMAQNDVADWLGELYLEAVLNSPEKNDYITLAKNSAEAALALWPAMGKELAEKQIPNTPVRPFSEYVGLYYNTLGNYHIAIFEKDEKLLMRFQREKNIAYDLTHYHYDTFSWLITHDRDAKLGRFPITRASFYLIDFTSYGEDDTQIDSLIWAHDDWVLEGERFFKKGGQCTDMIEPLPTTNPAPEPVVEMASSEVAQLASEVEGTVEIILEDARQQREVAVVGTELEEKTKGIVDGLQRAENGKL